MFWLILLLMLVAVGMMMMEVMLPFGISMMMGLILLGGAILMAFYAFGPERGMVYLIMGGLVAGGSVWWVMRRGTSLMALKPDRGGELGPGSGGGGEVDPPEGARARVIQPLRPTGMVQWEGRRYSARSLRPEKTLASGREVSVRGRDSIYLLVEPVEPAGENVVGGREELGQN